MKPYSQLTSEQRYQIYGLKQAGYEQNKVDLLESSAYPAGLGSVAALLEFNDTAAHHQPTHFIIIFLYFP